MHAVEWAERKLQLEYACSWIQLNYLQNLIELGSSSCNHPTGYSLKLSDVSANEKPVWFSKTSGFIRILKNSDNVTIIFTHFHFCFFCFVLFF